MAKKVIMSWSKCKIELGKTGADEAMATELFNIGTIKDKSTSMTTEDGDTLQAVATGGIVVSEEEGEPQVSITTRIMEMDFDTESKLTGAEKSGASGSETLKVTTNVIADDYSLKLTPKNIGATGIKARRTHISFRPGSSEEEGQYVDVTFKILACEDGELYTKFKVAADDWAKTIQASPASLDFESTVDSTGKKFTVSPSGINATAQSDQSWAKVVMSGDIGTVTTTAANSTGSDRTANITVTAGNLTTKVTVKQKKAAS